MDIYKKNHFILLLLSSLFFEILVVANEDLEDMSAVEIEKIKEDKIIITGSRIKRSDIEGASPITVITADDIERSGFTTVHEVMRSLTQANGNVQSESFVNGFTANAMTVNLRGMGPGYTLLLLNGKRIADYPMPYNGQSNFFNLASIPAAAIEKIELLSGGASAIYGSDAVAGVMNIVTKKDVEETTVSVRIGDTSEGGGESIRLQGIGGVTTERFNWTWTAEYYDVKPIFGFDRDYLDEFSDRPDYVPGETLYNGWSLIELNLFGSPEGLVDPTEEVCDRFEDYDYAINGMSQFYGGSDYQCYKFYPADQSLRSERDWLSIYNSFGYDLNENTELFSEIMLWDNNSVGSLNYQSWGSIHFDNNTGNLTFLGRDFQPSEVGRHDSTYDEESININIGIRGVIGDEDFDYEISFNRSTSNMVKATNAFKEEVINEYMLGDQLGEFIGFPIFAPDMERFYTPLTREETATMNGFRTYNAESESSNINAVLSGELFEMSAGVAEFALFVEYSEQSYDISLDARSNNPEGFRWYGWGGTQGGGSREHYAFGGELELPLLASLTGNIAVRYDNYADIGNASTGIGGAATYNVSLEWRPTDELLIRAKKATSFRAPDMHFIFATESLFGTTVTDFWACLTDDDPNNDNTGDCNASVRISGSRVGEPSLEEEEGDSDSVGIVYEVNNSLLIQDDSLFISLDYYKISLKNKINDYSISKILELESLCRTGQVDASSAGCIDALSRIERHPDNGTILANQLISVRTGPINSELIEREGIDLKADYNWNVAANEFRIELMWSHVLFAYNSQSVRDPAKWRDDISNFDLRSKLNYSFHWFTNDWSTTLTGYRHGSMPRIDKSGRSKTITTYNLNVSYQLTQESLISLSVQNLFNKKPVVDDSFVFWPYFHRNQGNAIGREIFLSYQYTF